MVYNFTIQFYIYNVEIKLVKKSYKIITIINNDKKNNYIY